MAFIVPCVLSKYNFAIVVNIVHSLSKSKKQYSEADANKTVSIARARVHVERGIQRMKRFKVLKKINLELLHFADSVLTVIAGVVSLSKSIFADDKYI